MSRYRIIVRNSPHWRDHNAATLGVSVTSPNWQGEKFASIMEFAATNFQVTRIDVTDALHRHNFMAEGAPPAQALARANALGALWLAQHQDVIDACGCPTKPQVVRWAEWYNHPKYSETLIGFERAHSINAILRDAVHADVIEFHRRKYRTPSLNGNGTRQELPSRRNGGYVSTGARIAERENISGR